MPDDAYLSVWRPFGSSQPVAALADSESALMLDRRLVVRALAILLVAAVAGRTGDLGAQEASSKSVAGAAALSLGAPGLAIGSYYVGEPRHAVVFTGGVAVSVLTALYASRQVSTYKGQRVSSCDGLVGCSSGPRSSTLATSSVLLAAVFWIGSASDAADGATRHNDRVRLGGTSRVTVAPTVMRLGDRPAAPGVAISFQF
jgi:hypothetical protein